MSGLKSNVEGAWRLCRDLVHAPASAELSVTCPHTPREGQLKGRLHRHCGRAVQPTQGTWGGALHTAGRSHAFSGEAGNGGCLEPGP